MFDYYALNQHIWISQDSGKKKKEFIWSEREIEGKEESLFIGSKILCFEAKLHSV